MRTTLNIDNDLLQELKQEARRSRMSLAATVNRVLRLGIERTHPHSQVPPYQGPTFSMGFPPLHDMDKALRLASMLEDEDTVRELTSGK